MCNYKKGWLGIRFNDTDENEKPSAFEFCRFEYGNAFNRKTGENKGGALYINGFDKVTVRNCRFL